MQSDKGHSTSLRSSQGNLPKLRAGEHTEEPRLVAAHFHTKDGSDHWWSVFDTTVKDIATGVMHKTRYEAEMEINVLIREQTI